MNWPFANKPRPRRKENARFRNRRRDSRLAVEVPMSRKEMRLRRRARITRLTRWSGIGLGAVVVAFYARSLWARTFEGNPEFTVGHFEYQSNGGIPAQQAAAAAGLRSDMNVMDVDLSDVRARLLALPRVKTVTVERRLPDKLAIQLEERLPVARITSLAHGIDLQARLFVDRDGVAIKCDEVLRDYVNLPVINAADQPVITLGRELDSAPVRAALHLLEEFRARDWSVPCSVSRIDIPNSWTLTAEMEAGPIFTFAPTGMKKQMERLEFILAKTRSAGRGVASVNLQMERNVPVRFFDQVAAEKPAPPRPGTAVPLVETENVRYTPPPAPARSRPAAPRGRVLNPSAASSEQQDIQTILRGI